MAKTITVRIEDDVYEMFKKAADGERRTISNFIETATLAYLVNEMEISDIEMKSILSDKNLVHELRTGLGEVKKGKYKIVS